MANTVFFSKKSLAPIIFEAFSYLQEKGLVASLFRYATETVPNSGKENERLIRLDDGHGHKLTGLFLKASKESMLERNARRAPRWFETPFFINGQEYYLSSQWNASGDFQLTLPNLNYFLKECCKNESDDSTFSIYKNGDEFVFAQGEFDENNEVLSQKNAVSKGSAIKQEFVLEEKAFPRQQIFFGAPGTGKSFKVNSILPNEDIWSVSGEIRKQLFLDSDTAKKAHYAEVLDNKEKFGDIWNVGELSVLEEKLSEVNSVDNVSNPEHSALQAYIKFLKEYKFERVFRTTFHPDYDYAQFVGAYKPKKVDNTITYSFIPQVFAKAYAAAWKQYIAADNKSTTENQVYLVIEEINRGNCAQIFGDIFQLLDRDADGFSQYSIDADCDFAEWLRENGINDGKLKLPPNLNILATMNTSDQSLFPMDSAFKRRFDWEYVPISFTDEEGEEKEAAAYQIEIDGTPYPWKDFVETVNDKILTLTESEDKQLGEFFIKPDNGNTISEGRFLGKVMFYLWNEVCKDEHKNGSFFRVKIDGKEEYFTFQDLYKKQGLLKQFMDELLKKE